MRFEWLAGAPFHFSPQVSWDGSAFPRCSSTARQVARSLWGVPRAMEELRSLALLGQGCQPHRKSSMLWEVASFVCTLSNLR